MTLWRGNVRRLFAVTCLAFSMAGIKQASAQPGPPPPDPLAAEMFVAITNHNATALRQALDKGAKLESENWLGITPLMWAAWSQDEAAVRLLLERGADVNHQSVYGGPLEAAEMGGSRTIFTLISNHGARPTQKRLDRMNAVMMAAQTGHTANLRDLLSKKLDVNATDATGMTALMHASRRGMTESVQILLKEGAKTGAVDSFGQNALMYAAQSGNAPTVGLLLRAGADPGQKDRNGDTPLILAARYNGSPEIARLLRATAQIKDRRGRNATAIARERGNPAFAMVLSPSTGTMSANMTLTADRKGLSFEGKAHLAAQKGLSLIEKTTATFSNKAACSSCHHQGVGLIATGTGKQYGYKIDNLIAISQQKIVTALPEAMSDDLKKLAPNPAAYHLFPTVDMNEATPAFAMSFAGLATHQVATSDALASIATIVMRLQLPDGSWGFGLNRAPLQSSRFTMTAYTLQMLQAYLPADLAAERMERTARALTWLSKTPARNGEDRAFRLLALKWANAPQSEISSAVQDLRKAQKPDGGWAQFDGAGEAGAEFARSDAYATGQALYALHLGGGVPVSDPSYRKGTAYLVRTQDDDGSWFVNKRAMPANNFLDTGFPHGQSQYASYSATAYATMALMFAAEPTRRPVAMARGAHLTR